MLKTIPKVQLGRLIQRKLFSLKWSRISTLKVEMKTICCQIYRSKMTGTIKKMVN